MAKDVGSNRQAEQFQAAPTISLPKGGGAVRGIGEKFAANPVTGTGSTTVPIATTPNRSGFGPQLALSYDSGAGNGCFGFGWSLSVPAITRKTDKGLPQYRDHEESDVFILSGAEDLVPVLRADGSRFADATSTPGYTIHRYRPRVEGLFARIERWTTATGETHWRSITRDNVTTLYGADNNSKIFDPSDPEPEQPTRVFSWLISESYDDKGNGIVYEYKPENSDGVPLNQAHERNRSLASRRAQRYLKRVKYGNRISRLLQPDLGRADWMFEIVLDYGEHGRENPRPLDAAPWACRHDPFSSYRAGFEVRTYRLCQRVLMFHHFPDREVGGDCLVRSTDIVYRDTRGNPEDRRLGHPVASFVSSISQSGYKRRAEGGYLKRSLPPLEFTYSEVSIDEEIRELDSESLENLPTGVDGGMFQWVDLDGEAVSGLLTEQAGSWFYKRNLGEGRFGPLEPVTAQPSIRALRGARQQLLDLAGDGNLDLVEFAGPGAGFFERTANGGWERFRSFARHLQLAWDDPNLRFVDLDGDGHADVLITEQDAMTWHRSLGEEGFGPAQRLSKPHDEELGPRLVFADGAQSVYLADMSGDGLTDLVRIRNGEVCYWPNLGYGRFGARVTMDDAPWFDVPELFDQRRIRVADIDGSGNTDIIYLARDDVRLYFNQSGNRWSAARTLAQFPPIDDLAAVTAVDLLGNGTACLVWSSPLPGSARRPMRYIDLMGGRKPHLLIGTVNNLGAETHIEYAPSTKFYLADKRARKPWLTRLPFPVHCVERVSVADKWRKTTFSTTYSYHHGYFDGAEREFRGFGCVKQVDAESYGTFAFGNTNSPYITSDHTLYQPPVETVTWFHTGAATDGANILSAFADEYFPRWFENARPSTDVLGGFEENALPEPDFDGIDPTAEDWREAIRACKGMALRQEIYELDVDALERGEARRVKLFSAATHNCHIRRVQPRIGYRHAVFLVTESEVVTYHYELDLRADTVRPDPRVAHTLNLAVDEYGNVLQSVAAVYPRRGRHEDSELTSDDLRRIHDVQTELHLVYTEHRYTRDVEDADTHRLRVPCEVLTYELTGVAPLDSGDAATADSRDRYFDLGDLRRLRLSTEHQADGEPITDLAYHQLPDRTTPQKRIVEHVRTLFFADDLSGPLPFRQHGRLGRPYESYTLALTEDLLTAVLSEKLTRAVRRLLDDPTSSGYLSGPALAGRFSGLDTIGEYWRRSGIAGLAPDAAVHFYLPERYTDPFGNVTRIEYDPLDLFVVSSTDAMENTTRVTRFDFRVLAPSEIADANGNLSETYFDVLGLAAAAAVRGQGDEGDSLSGLDDVLANAEPVALAAFFAAPAYTEAQARAWLGDATTRHIYYFGETVHDDGMVTWGTHPPCACGVVRERHVAQLARGEESRLQAGFEYSDGLGAVLLKKVQAEPDTDGGPLRWIASGRTVLNNKGKPVKQYEPSFSDHGHRFEDAPAAGVTPVMYYDAVGRLVRTEAPDGSYSRVEFSPWHVATFDAHDTVLEPHNLWYSRRLAPAASAEDRRAAQMAAKHAGTPTLTLLDSSGRDVVAIAHNRLPTDAPEWSGTPLLDRLWVDQKHVTFTKLDAEGKPLWIRDARRNLVMQYILPPAANNEPSDPERGFAPCYDIAGNLLFQHSMDAGDRWTLNDAAGKPMLAWDVNDRLDDAGVSRPESRLYRTEYDALHRPMEVRLSIEDGPAQLIESFVYGESLPDVAEARSRNLRGQLHRHYHPGGLLARLRLDFKGNVLEAERTAASAYRVPVIDWSASSPTVGLDDETFRQVTEYDALNRIARQYGWHRTLRDAPVAVYEPRYNARGLLTAEDLVIRATKRDDGYVEGVAARRTSAIHTLTYDAKGQMQCIRYGNGVTARYEYDPETFRLRQLRTTRPDYDPPFPAHHSGLRDRGVLQQLNYTYDAVGNITDIYDEAYEPRYFQNHEVHPHSTYLYEALYRLIQATGRENGAFVGPPRQVESDAPVVSFPVTASGALRNYTQRYLYDAVGNIDEMRHAAGPIGSWTQHYSYAADSNRLLRTWTGGAEVDAVRYHYDTHGSMLNLANVPAPFRLQWDHRDMIHAVNLGGGGRAYYSYDAGKERTRKVITSDTGVPQWERVYLGGTEVYRRYQSDRVVEEIETHHLFVGETRVLIVEDVVISPDRISGEGPRFRYQLIDHLGSSCTELDEDAEIITYESYHPYGTSAYHACRNAAEVQLRRYRYTAKERDKETGLNYHSARYYAPWLGRWPSADPLGVRDSVNVYGYVRSNPMVRSDPRGRITLDQVNRRFDQLRNRVEGTSRHEGRNALNDRVDDYNRILQRLVDFRQHEGTWQQHTAELQQIRELERRSTILLQEMQQDLTAINRLRTEIDRLEQTIQRQLRAIPGPGPMPALDPRGDPTAYEQWEAARQAYERQRAPYEEQLQTLVQRKQALNSMQRSLDTYAQTLGDNLGRLAHLRLNDIPPPEHQRLGRLDPVLTTAIQIPGGQSARPVAPRVPAVPSEIRVGGVPGRARETEIVTGSPPPISPPVHVFPQTAPPPPVSTGVPVWSIPGLIIDLGLIFLMMRVGVGTGSRPGMLMVPSILQAHDSAT